MRQLLQDWIHRAVMIVLVAVTGLTTRKTWINRHILEVYEAEGQNFIAGTWHNNIVYFTHLYGQLRLAALISRSRDGENIARVSGFFGVHPIRGSTSRESLGGVRGLLRVLAAGRSATVTPDGPRGPRYVLQPGIVAAAQLARVPIVPMAYSGRRMIEFNSWDRMKLPLPFSRIVIYLGDPVWVDREEGDSEQARRRVEQAMRRAEALVDRFAGGGRVEREPLLAQALEPSGEGERR
jgi:lysophospholipid acyltransferase (LPLAT)-like uncharacterized protein